MDLRASHVTVNRLEIYRLTSAVVQSRLCYVYTKQIDDVHDIKPNCLSLTADLKVIYVHDL